ncbi:MAG: efflux RND transporter permease subunit, partial [Myxococcota bacterium]
MLTLTISYGFAMTVTPVMSVLFLRPKPQSSGRRLGRFVDWAGRAATGGPWSITAIAVLLVVASGIGAGFVDKSFFPAAGRAQFVVEQMLPEGTHLDETDRTTRKLETFLRADERVTQVSSFMGRSAPKFYYNLPRRLNSPHLAQIVIQTNSADDLPSLMADIRRFAAKQMPEATVIPRRLEQGPPIDAPIEIHVQGQDLESLYAGAERVMATLREIPGVIDVHHNQGLGIPALELTVNDGAAGRRGLARRDIALAVLGQTRGLPAGQLRSGEDPIPILVRAKEGERLSPNRLPGVVVASQEAGMVPLAQLAELDVKWKPAAIHRRNRIREITVSSHLAEGAAYGKVLADFERRFDASTLSEGTRFKYGGAAEGSGKANSSIARAAPMGVVLLLFFLMVEFNSFRRVGLILTTVPLAAAGVIPGLIVGQQPFGFMSLLGVIALIGVVVNNAIVLVDVIESGRKSGLSVRDAVARSVRLRARPILLTTATTVAGLTPLAFSPSPLWPPLASAMIAGLLASTFLTLLVVPALYTLLFKDGHGPVSTARSAAAAALLIWLAPSTAGADPISLSDAMKVASTTPVVAAAEAQAEAADQQAKAEWRQGYLPTVGAQASINSYDRLLSLSTPIGDFPFGAKSFYQIGVDVRQPIFDPTRLFGTAPAADLTAQGARLAAR